MQKWARDEAANHCANCHEEFTFFKRKVDSFLFCFTLLFTCILRQHHCRSCGLIFCHECSSRTALTTASATPVRVCDDCYGRIEGIDQSTAGNASGDNDGADNDASIVTSITSAISGGFESLFKATSSGGSAPVDKT